MMKIKSAKYVKTSIEATGSEKTQGIRIIYENNESWFAPIEPANTLYTEIMRQVDAGELTIEEAS